MKRPPRLALPIVLFAAAATLARASPTQAATVAIVTPLAPSSTVVEALTLLRGELLSVGLAVTVVDRPTTHSGESPDSRRWLDDLATSGANAIVDVVPDEGRDGEARVALDVWVAKTLPQRFEVTRVTVEPATPRPAEVLALRTIEALRAGLLQIDWAQRRRRTPAQPALAAPAAGETRDDIGERVGLEIGAALMMSPDGLGPAVLPTLEVGWAARRWLLLQVATAGLGSRSTLATAAGEARVAQQFALLGGQYHASPRRRLWPFLGLAAGVLRTSVTGLSGSGTGGHSAERWSGVLDVGLGTGLRLYGRSYLTLSAHAQFAAPYVAVYVVDTLGATSGRPNLMLTLTMGAWL